MKCSMKYPLVLTWLVSLPIAAVAQERVASQTETSTAMVMCSDEEARNNDDNYAIANEILAQEKRWAAALVAGDLDTVASIMHRDFRLVRVYSDEPPISKEMYLGMQGMSVSSATVTSVTITEEAGPIVVARVTWIMDWEQQGVGKLPPHFDMIDTWIKGQDGVWRVLARVSQFADDSHRAQQKGE